jgi:hypothetical protein
LSCPLLDKVPRPGVGVRDSPGSGRTWTSLALNSSHIVQPALEAQPHPIAGLLESSDLVITCSNHKPLTGPSLSVSKMTWHLTSWKVVVAPMCQVPEVGRGPQQPRDKPSDSSRVPHPSWSVLELKAPQRSPKARRSQILGSRRPGNLHINEYPHEKLDLAHEGTRLA